MVAVAIVALCAPTVVTAYECPDLNCPDSEGYFATDYSAFRCNDQELKFISMEVIQCSLSSTDPRCNFYPYTENPTGIATVANYEITSYGHKASHVNFRVPPEFEPFGCTGCTTEGTDFLCDKPDPSTNDCSGIYPGYLCLLKVNLDGTAWNGNTLAFSVAVAGQYDKGPRDAFVRSTADPSIWAYGPSLSFYPFSRAEVVNSTRDQFTVKDPADPTVVYKIEVFKDGDGNITQVLKNGIDITDQGIPWGQIRIKFPGKDPEFVNYVKHKSSTKSGEESTCAYWYRGVFYDYCN
jgi:hypothetical protein